MPAYPVFFPIFLFTNDKLSIVAVILRWTFQINELLELHSSNNDGLLTFIVFVFFLLRFLQKCEKYPVSCHGGNSM